MLKLETLSTLWHLRMLFENLIKYIHRTFDRFQYKGMDANLGACAFNKRSLQINGNLQ